LNSIKVLIVDDEEPFRRLLKNELSRKGFITDTAENGSVALYKIAASDYDVVLLDIVMPELDGLEFLRKLQTDPSSPTVIVLTGRATIDTAVEAMKHGAFDYLTKPYRLEELVIVINKAFEQRRLLKEHRLLQDELSKRELPDRFIGRSPQIKEILSLIEKIAPTDSTVLIEGESGTGKELVARYIWQLSRRKSKPLIALNSSTLSEHLIESELFGHEKGAFTSAFQVKHGLVEIADGGTLFLDEIGDMPPQVQAKLLRFLDSGEFRRVGGNKTLMADVRIIAATNKSLEVEVEKGSFREDLFYRLNVIRIYIPPLRDRKEDILPLAEFFLEKYSRKLSKRLNTLHSTVKERFLKYHWPGNVRELENVIERGVILCDTEVLGPEHISIPDILPPVSEKPLLSLDELEKEYILKVLKHTHWNQTQASRILGIDRKTLYLKLKRYGLKK
jgi:DNA-binding NtrC family response regulator